MAVETASERKRGPSLQDQVQVLDTCDDIAQQALVELWVRG